MWWTPSHRYSRNIRQRSTRAGCSGAAVAEAAAVGPVVAVAGGATLLQSQSNGSGSVDVSSSPSFAGPLATPIRTTYDASHDTPGASHRPTSTSCRSSTFAGRVGSAY